MPYKKLFDSVMGELLFTFHIATIIKETALTRGIDPIMLLKEFNFST